MIEIDPDVKIAAVAGGYIVSAVELDGEAKEWEPSIHAVSTIDEVLRLVRLTLEARDAEPDATEAVEEQLKAKRK